MLSVKSEAAFLLVIFSIRSTSQGSSFLSSSLFLSWEDTLIIFELPDHFHFCKWLFNDKIFKEYLNVTTLVLETEKCYTKELHSQGKVLNHSQEHLHSHFQSSAWTSLPDLTASVSRTASIWDCTYTSVNMKARLHIKHFDKCKMLPSLKNIKCRYKKEGDLSAILKVLFHVAQNPDHSRWPKLPLPVPHLRLPAHSLPVHDERKHTVSFNNIHLTIWTWKWFHIRIISCTGCYCSLVVVFHEKSTSSYN